MQRGGLADPVASQQGGHPGRRRPSKVTPCRMCEPPIRTRRSRDRSRSRPAERSQRLPQVGLLHRRVGHHRGRGVADRAARRGASRRPGRPGPSTTSMWCSTISTVRPLGAGQAADQLDQRRHVLGADPGHRLVEQQHLRPRGQQQRRSPACASRRATASPAGGVDAGRPGRPGPARRASGRRPSGRPRAPEPHRAAAGRACTASRTFSSTVSDAEHRRGLEGAAEPEPGPPVRRQPGDVRRRPGDPAGGRPEQPGDQVEQRGLAGAVGADDGEELTRREVEVDVVDNGYLADAPGEPVEWSSTGSASALHRRPRAARPASGVSALTSSGRRAVPLAGQLGLEHRLQQRVVLRPDA